jgi:hypothetical protein
MTYTLSRKEKEIASKAKNLRFLQIKTPLKSTSASQVDHNDPIQSMKQNAEIMNQVIKNIYAIYGKEKHHKVLQNYVSLEMFVEKEVIKFYVAAPQDFLESLEKNISSFYPGSVIDYLEQPKILEAGKFWGGGTYAYTKPDGFPLKTYESFEADPMESILSAFSRVQGDEKLSVQILIAPVDEKDQAAMRKKVEDIKE